MLWKRAFSSTNLSQWLSDDSYSFCLRLRKLSFCCYCVEWAFQVVLSVKTLPLNARNIRDMGSIPGSEDPLEEGMATHSSDLAWRIPWTEEPGGLQVHKVAKSRTRLKWLNMHVCKVDSSLNSSSCWGSRMHFNMCFFVPSITYIKGNLSQLLFPYLLIWSQLTGSAYE